MSESAKFLATCVEKDPHVSIARFANTRDGSGDFEPIRQDLEMNRCAARRNPANPVAVSDQSSGLKAVGPFVGEISIRGVEADPGPKIVIEDRIAQARLRSLWRAISSHRGAR